MDEYRHYHDNIWPEVAAGLRVAGVTQLTIFQLPGTNTIVMYITTAGHINLGLATGPGSTYRLDPRCKEWEELMDAGFHGGWTEMEEIHSSDNQWNRSLRVPMGAPPTSVISPVPPQSPTRINQSALSRGQMGNLHSRYEGVGNVPPKTPPTGRRGYNQPGGASQIKFG